MSAAADVRRTDPRPALADVLAALTGESRGAWLAILREYVGLPRDLRWERDALVWGRPWQAQREGGRDPRVTRRPWITTPAAHAPLIACGAVVSVEVAPAHTITPAEAVEALYAREAPLWPWSPGDDAAPRWWCEACTGCGEVWMPDDLRPCSRCAAVGSTADPPSLASFVAVASLGVPTLRNAYGLAAQLVGRAPRVTFRVMARESLVRCAREASWLLLGHAPRTIAALASLTTDWSLDTRRVSDPPWWVCEAPDDVQRAWPVLRDLAALGLHLVALDGDRVTLAVEAI